MENSNNGGNMTIEDNDGTGNRNLALKLGFLTFKAKIVFV